MEAIENEGGSKRTVLNRGQIRSPHIQTDGLKNSGFAFFKPSKALIQRLSFSVQSYPQKISQLHIIDPGGIVMSLLVRNLIKELNDRVESILSGTIPRGKNVYLSNGKIASGIVRHLKNIIHGKNDRVVKNLKLAYKSVSREFVLEIGDE